MPTNNTLLMGAVACDAKMAAIWDGLQRYFARHGGAGGGGKGTPRNQ